MLHASPQVIILDQDGDQRRIVETLLRAHGLTVAATDDAHLAIQLAQAEATELLLVDLSMAALEAVPRWARRRGDPEPRPPAAVEGYALLRSLGREPLLGRLPLVVLRNGSPEHGAGQRYGILDVIAKPVDGERLRAKVARALADDAPHAEGAGVTETEHDGKAPLAFEAIPRAMRTALVVDPDARFRQWIRGLMAIHGFRVHEAEDAAHGLAVALGERPWLVLAELDLPGGLDGLDFCRRMRAQALTAHIPVVLLSDHDDYDDRYRGLEAGADDFVSKRVTARETLIRIQLVLKRYAELDARTGREGAAMGGRLELVGAPGVLQMCHLGQLSGLLRVHHGEAAAEFGFRNGEIVRASTPHSEGTEAVYAFMEWSEGRFEFVPGATREGPRFAERFDELLIEGCRRFDERRRTLPSAAVA